MYITKQTHRLENKLVVTSGEKEGERGQEGVEDEETQTTMYKVSNRDILYSTGKYSHYFVITLNGL